MKKVLSILSLTVVAIIFGTSLNGCSEDDVTTPNQNNSNTTDSTDNNSNNSECIKCNDYEVGDTFSIDEVTYTVADRDMLDDALQKGKDLTKYCTSKVTDMVGMFGGAKSFNQDIGNWNVSNVSYMNSMFNEATSFNQDLTQWCVSKISSNS